jgi:WXG100 family type VII secretion target
MSGAFATGDQELITAAKDITDTNEEIRSILAGLNSAIDTVEGVWKGEAYRAFHALNERFDKDAKDLNDALASIAEQISGTVTAIVQQQQEQSESMNAITSRLKG